MAYLEGRLLKDAGSIYEDTVKRIISENICEEIKTKKKRQRKRDNKTVIKLAGDKGKETKKKRVFGRKEDEADGRYDE